MMHAEYKAVRGHEPGYRTRLCNSVGGGRRRTSQAVSCWGPGRHEEHSDLAAEQPGQLTGLGGGQPCGTDVLHAGAARTFEEAGAAGLGHPTEEIEIQEDYQEVPYFHFMKQALPALVPMLLETLTKQEEDQDVDEGAWNLCMAGGTCLGLVARAVGDDVVPLITPFVQENISKGDWIFREAATYAFGSILEGPSLDKLSTLVHDALPVMLQAMKDENNHVKLSCRPKQPSGSHAGPWRLRRLGLFFVSLFAEKNYVQAGAVLGNVSPDFEEYQVQGILSTGYSSVG